MCVYVCVCVCFQDVVGARRTLVCSVFLNHFGLPPVVIAVVNAMMNICLWQCCAGLHFLIKNAIRRAKIDLAVDYDMSKIGINQSRQITKWL